MAEYDRIRLVVLGGSGVGKSSIIKRFLFDTFCEKYKPTVEDLYCQKFNLGQLALNVDILDTAGDFQFPAMRRLSIASANAFLLVYSVDMYDSFLTIQECVKEINDTRSDAKDVPLVIVANKADLTHKQVSIEEVRRWLLCDTTNLRTEFLECSAKDDIDIKRVFKTLAGLYKFPPGNKEECKLKRHTSVYQRSGRNSSPNATKVSRDDEGVEIGMEGVKFKPRSRSLMRRTSRKFKQSKEPSSSEECKIS